MHKPLVIRVVIGIVIGGAIGAVFGYFGQCTTGTCPLTANPWRGALYGAFMGALLAFSASTTTPS